MTRRLQAIDFGPHGVAVFPAVVDVAKEAEQDPNAVFDNLLSFRPRPR